MENFDWVFRLTDYIYINEILLPSDLAMLECDVRKDAARLPLLGSQPLGLSESRLMLLLRRLLTCSRKHTYPLHRQERIVKE
jgi:hypothetical protein